MAQAKTKTKAALWTMGKREPRMVNASSRQAAVNKASPSTLSIQMVRNVRSTRLEGEGIVRSLQRVAAPDGVACFREDGGKRLTYCKRSPCPQTAAQEAAAAARAASNSKRSTRKYGDATMGYDRVGRLIRAAGRDAGTQTSTQALALQSAFAREMARLRAGLKKPAKKPAKKPGKRKGR